MDRRNAGHRRRLAPQGFGIVHGEIFAMNFFWSGRTTKTRVKLGKKDRIRTQRLDLIRKCFVKSLNDRDHKDYGDHTDTDAEYCQRRAQLICAQGVEGHQGGFFDVVKAHRQVVRTQDSGVRSCLLQYLYKLSTSD